MIEKQVTIVNESGLHAKPASQVVNFVRNYKGQVLVSNEGKRGNLKSIISILSLGLRKGDTIRLQIEGDGEHQFAAELVEFIEKLEG